MPVYRYKAVNAAGEVLEGKMDAPSQSVVVERLHDAGHVPIRADEDDGPSLRSLLQLEIGGGRRFSSRDLALATRQIATLLHAGLPLDRALEILTDLTDTKAGGSALRQVLDRIRSGSSLADACAAQPRMFPSFYASMVRAGETGGNLDAVLSRLADFLESADRLKETIRSALIYPVVVLAICAISLVILLGFVLPQFESIFEEAGSALPLPTQILIASAHFVERYWWAMAGMAGVCFWLMRRQLRAPASRYRWHLRMLRLPFLGDLIAKAEVARFTRTIGTLLANGVALPTALHITKGTVSNAAIVAVLEGAAGRIKEGKGLAEPLAQSGLIPQLAIRLIRVGEETSRLDDMLLKVSSIYEQEVQRTVDRLLALLVPGMTVTLGLLVAGIIGSILVAMLSVYELAL